jgi:hypothetical protein
MITKIKSEEKLTNMPKNIKDKIYKLINTSLKKENKEKKHNCLTHCKCVDLEDWFSCHE